MDSLMNKKHESATGATAEDRVGIRPMFMAVAAIVMATIVLFSPFALPLLLRTGMARMLQYPQFIYPPSFHQRLNDHLLGTVALWALMVCLPFALFACVRNLSVARIQSRGVESNNWRWIPFVISAAAVAFIILGLLVIVWALSFAIE